MNPRIALFLSVVCHPLLMPTGLFGLLLWLTPAVLGLDLFSSAVRISVVVIVFVGTFVGPSLLIFYLYRSGLIPSLHLENRADRKLPYFLTAIIYASLTYIFRYRMGLLSDSSPEISVLLGSITISILLVGVISLWWKISAHGVGVGGLVGALLAVLTTTDAPSLFWPALGSVVLAGLVGTARLALNAHTLAQVLTGLGLGIVVSTGAVVWLL